MGLSGRGGFGGGPSLPPGVNCEDALDAEVGCIGVTPDSCDSSSKSRGLAVVGDSGGLLWEAKAFSGVFYGQKSVG